MYLLRLAAQCVCPCVSVSACLSERENIIMYIEIVFISKTNIQILKYA